MGISTIYNEDFLVGVKEYKNESVDLIITDPPYGVNFCNSKFYDDKNVFEVYEKWLYEMHRVLKENAHIYIFIPTLEVDKWVSAVKEVFEFNNLLSTQIYINNRYLKNNFGFDLQLIIFASKGKAKRLNAVDWIPASESWKRDKRNKNPKDFTYQYPSVIPPNYKANIKNNHIRKRIHPNEKNPELIEKFILLSSNENDLVMDPFIGSASTPIACIRTNRRFCGFELSQDYYKNAIKRINDEMTRFVM